MKYYRVDSFGNYKSLDKIIEFLNTSNEVSRAKLVRLIVSTNIVIKSISTNMKDSESYNYILGLLRKDLLLRASTLCSRYNYPKDVESRLKSFICSKINENLQNDSQQR